MANFICQTCGTQYPDSVLPPEHCPICEDQRQYIGAQGQTWTTLEKLSASHHNRFATIEPGLIGIGTEPSFAIGQRALLVQTPEGNILWDCISLIDEMTIRLVNSLGGIAAIAISHPHYYSSMVEWSQAFKAPIYLHAYDRRWVMRPDSGIVYWENETRSLPGGLSLIRCGGHFQGGTVLHWPTGASGKGVLLTGDIIQVVSDHHWVSFMYSYPNLIPLPANSVSHIAEAVKDYPFDRIYGAWWDKIVDSGAKGAVSRSAVRYINALEGNLIDA